MSACTVCRRRPVNGSGSSARKDRFVSLRRTMTGVFTSGLTTGVRIASRPTVHSPGAAKTPPGNALDFDGADDHRIASGAGVAQTPAVVSSPTHADVSYTTATLGASIASTGDTAIVERGIVWSTDFDFMPDAGTTVSESAGFYGTGVFSVAVSALPEDTTVYFRGIARDGSGDSYS